MSTEVPNPKPRRIGRRILFIGAVTLIFTCGICGIISILLPDADTGSTAEVAEQPTIAEERTDTPAEPTAARIPTNTIEPSPVPTEPPSPTEPPPTVASEPTQEPQPTATEVSLQDIGELRDLTSAELALRATIDEALGESNRSLGRKLNLFSPGLPGLVENSIIIGWAADTAASNALIREGMQRDTLTVLRAVRESGIDYDQVLIGSQYLMTNDQFDITDEMEVLTLSYSRDTLNSIDWDAITAGEIFQVADLFIIDPMFEE